ncbi:hypothetical protein AHMF7605_13215 [Adhaeribacter arboris]|uniref:Uncharacterized protein n=1 Tax=Adhaeribacter arboris TaxID=2072846 RepID=A0A2T2YFX0_9BACT|nr:hypothetical protein [Adhaeribacter arboris]PSR54400.1 hypothetical protein AHMF7605_13215 [Adhaeribacter arboris]
MKRIIRLLLSCVLGLLLPAVIFPWLVRLLVPARKTSPEVTFTPVADSAKVNYIEPIQGIKAKPILP